MARIPCRCPSIDSHRGLLAMYRYGGTFATHVQYVLETRGPNATYLRVTAEIEWLKSCMLKSTISKKIETNVIKSFNHVKV
mmetsp:Transcript_19387/g.57663  ORF Transcript_19387/g.57663 Transcript_19387/m.57663 type:complete len:81 (-) Transcript_19387:3260-3502(-)